LTDQQLPKREAEEEPAEVETEKAETDKPDGGEEAKE
jgi:hypothetical protein